VSLRAKAFAACSCSRTRLQWSNSFEIGHPLQPCAYCCLLEERRSCGVTLAHAAAAVSPALLQPLPTASFPHSLPDSPHRNKRKHAIGSICRRRKNTTMRARARSHLHIFILVNPRVRARARNTFQTCDLTAPWCWRQQLQARMLLVLNNASTMAACQRNRQRNHRKRTMPMARHSDQKQVTTPTPPPVTPSLNLRAVRWTNPKQCKSETVMQLLSALLAPPRCRDH